jgi:hypothetical protein
VLFLFRRSSSETEIVYCHNAEFTFLRHRLTPKSEHHLELVMSIIATKSNGTTDITYELASEQGARKEFINKAAGLTEAERLVVTHNLRPNGAKGTDIHSFVFSKGDVDDTTGQFTLGSVEVILRVPCYCVY